MVVTHHAAVNMATACGRAASLLGKSTGRTRASSLAHSSKTSAVACSTIAQDRGAWMSWIERYVVRAAIHEQRSRRENMHGQPLGNPPIFSDWQK